MGRRAVAHHAGRKPNDACRTRQVNLPRKISVAFSLFSKEEKQGARHAAGLWRKPFCLMIGDVGESRHRAQVCQQAAGGDGSQPADQRGPSQAFRTPGKRRSIQFRIPEYSFAHDHEKRDAGKNKRHFDVEDRVDQPGAGVGDG